MILVTGTKRAGTSLWMQVFRAGGFELFGEAFPRDWSVTLRDANPHGFYESALREGIYYRTNPNPRTGAYFLPAQVERHVVKVFVPGLVRTDLAYIGHVLATIRPWREYAASLTRLLSIEDEARPELAAKRPAATAPALEWWSENFALLRDMSLRRYPAHVCTYDALLRDPERAIRGVFDWLGNGDAKSAAAVVDGTLRTQHVHGGAGARVGVVGAGVADASTETGQPGGADPTSLSPEGLDPETAAVADELYATLDGGRPLSAGLLGRMNDTELRLRAAASSRATRG
ncbi:MAG: hypothetical protein H6700_03610 [Myxococcales bacterium]|nr:hypothetical protein [Myxococcales bacterium]MCB9530828.1 hypothetical protein [Myxococcales bacterium]